MSTIFPNTPPDKKRSIRNIPIPTRAEREAFEAEAVLEDEETAADNIQKPGTEPLVRKIAHGAVHRMDGMKSVKRPARGKKRNGTVAHPTSSKTGEHVTNIITNTEDESEIEVSQDTHRHHQVSLATAKRTHHIEPAFVDAEYVRKETSRSDTEPAEYVTDSTPADADTDSFDNWNRKHKRGYVFWIITVTLAVIFLAILSSFFVRATVIVTPKKYDISLESTKLYISDIQTKTVQAEAEASSQISAKGTVNVDRKASGTVVLYNAYSSADQKLVANTRIETSDGKIFRLVNAVTIPGQKTVGGKKVPGSAEVSVQADKTGSEYNVGFKDFKVTAYKGSDRYDTIYGRSKTSIGNGYSGEVPNISQKEIASSTEALRQILVEKMQSSFKDSADKSGTYAYVPDAHVITYEPVEQKASSDGKTVTLTGKAKGTAILFETKTFSKQLLHAENTVPLATSSGQTKISYTGDISKVHVSFPKDTISTDLTIGKNAYITVVGTTTIYASVDPEIITQAISNLSKEQAVPVLHEFVDSDEITIKIWPWWISTLPTKTDIEVDIL